ncbi:MAG: glycosyltransferase [Chloroflexi bacterium]|nr:glycosyltransferase [Chloroflexota bacterium]
MNEPRLAILNHGGPLSIAAYRARGLSRGYPADRLLLLMREATWQTAAQQWHRQIKQFSPDLLYVVNLAMPGVLLALGWRAVRGLPFILDTGDVNFEMARSAGTTVRWKRPLLKWMEAAGQRWADVIVVRGTRHREYLQSRNYRRVEVIRDGYCQGGEIRSDDVATLRARLGLADKFVVGVMGSLVHSPHLNICYGWDLIQALSLLKDLPIHGLIIGDGDGRSWLEKEARRYQVLERVTFCGRIPYPDVPLYLRVLEVALSTQTNNLPGQVRTTGKLPEYLAAERFVLASRVGEAELLLPDCMLLEYHGAVDAEYPRRLAGRLRALCADRSLLEARHSLKAVAERHCSYEVLSRQFRHLIASVRLTDRS